MSDIWKANDSRADPTSGKDHTGLQLNLTGISLGERPPTRESARRPSSSSALPSPVSSYRSIRTVSTDRSAKEVIGSSNTGNQTFNKTTKITRTIAKSPQPVNRSPSRRRPNTVHSTRSRPASSTLSKQSTTASSSSSSRNSSSQAMTKISRTAKQKTKLKKHTDFIDETLFGNGTRMSIEEEHIQMHKIQDALDKKKMLEMNPPPQKKMTPRSTRCDLNTPVELPSGPLPNPERFRKTSTLQGGYGPPRNPKPGVPPYRDTANLLKQQPRHKQPAMRPGTAPAKLKSPFIHENNQFKASTKPRPPIRNNIWSNMPDV